MTNVTLRFPMFSICPFADRTDSSRWARRGRTALFGLLLGCAIVSPSPAHAVCSEFGLPSGSEIVEFQTNRGQICLELLRQMRRSRSGIFSTT